MASTPTPLKVRVDKGEKTVVIVWSDGIRNQFPWAYLRSKCPSAGEQVERDKQSANPLAVLGKVPSSELTNVRMVGNYAIGFSWADGHDAGIYTWEYLRTLAEDPCVDTSAIA